MTLLIELDHSQKHGFIELLCFRIIKKSKINLFNDRIQHKLK